MTTWTTPRTWADNDLVDAADLNEQLRDNLEALKDPPSDSYVADEATNYATDSTSWVDVDDTNMALQITTHGGDIMIGFHGNLKRKSGNADYACFNVDYNGSKVAGGDGILASSQVGPGVPTPVSFVRLLTGLDAGTYTFKLQWKVLTGGVGYGVAMYSGDGDANWDMHPQFWVREVS